MPVSTQNAASLTQEQVQKVLVTPLETKSHFLACVPSSNIHNSNGAPVRLPKLGSPTNPSWVGENELIPETDVEFDQVTLLPSTLKSVKTISRFSNEMARQSVIALDQAMKTRLVLDVSAKIDDGLFNGDGTNGTPVGLVNFPDAQEVNGVGVPTLDDLHDAVGLALAANVDPDSNALRWVMNSRDFVNLRKIKDGQDRYQMTPDPTAAGKFTLLGFPVTISNRLGFYEGADADVEVNESNIALADFSQIAVARDLAPSVTILSERYGEYDQQAIRVVTRYDAAPLNGEAVVILRDVAAPPAV